MATSNIGINPLIQRMRGDSVLGTPPVDVQQQFAQQHPFAPSGWAPPAPVAAPNVMQAGIQPQQSVQPSMSFGMALPAKAKAAAMMTPASVQTAGALSNMQAQVPNVMFQQRLMDAGINLNPQGQAAGDYQRNVAAAQGIYNSVFGAGLPANATGGPVQAFAPTGLRERALAAPGTPVWGQGNVMAQADGLNAQGGQRFSLGQYVPLNGFPSPAPNPIEPDVSHNVAPASAAQPTPFQQNASVYQSAVGGSQDAMRAAFAPGVTDHVGAYIQAGGRADPQTLKALADIEVKRQASDIKGANNRAMQIAYGADTGTTPPPSNSAGSPSQQVDPVEEAQTHLKNAIDAGLTNPAVINKLSANVQQAKAHQILLSQVNEQNDSLMHAVDQAIQLAPHAGKFEGRTLGWNDNVNQLHSLIEQIGGNEIMDYIQRMKSSSPLGQVGLRVLDSEVKAISNVYAPLRDEKVPLIQQDPKFVAQKLNEFKYHLGRVNMAVNGINPDTRDFATEADMEKAAAKGLIHDGDKVIVNKNPDVYVAAPK